MDMQKSINPIILAFIGMIIVGMLLIPFLLDLTHEPDINQGSTVSYQPRTNLDADFTYSGTLLDHSQYTIDPETDEITITFTEEGTYTLIVTATSHNPYQTATQTIEYEVGDYSEYHDYKPLLLLVPTMFLVAFMMLVLGRKSGGDGFGDDSGFGGGSDIAGKFGRGGFGKR